MNIGMLLAALCWMAIPMATWAAPSCALADSAEDPPRTTEQDVSSRAERILATRLGANEAKRYRLNGAKFDAQAKVWLVFFRDRGPTVPIDSEPTVWIDDRSDRTCVSWGIDIGQCLIPMFRLEEDTAQADSHCSSTDKSPQ